MRSDEPTYKINRSVGIDVVRLTEGAARGAALRMGQGDEGSIFRAAIDGFLAGLTEVSLGVDVAMGETLPGLEDALANEFSDAEERLPVDIAIKLVECRTACAIGGRNAMSAMVVAPRGSVNAIPQMYMEKIACGPEAREAISFDLSPPDLIRAVAEAKKVHPEQLTVTILDRPRNHKWIEGARSAGARVQLIADGDLAAAIATAVPESGIDLLLGSGGALEGWLAAAALKGLGGGFYARFLTMQADDERKLVSAGFEDPRRPVDIYSLLPEEFVFSATGITDGDALRGIRYRGTIAESESLMVRTTSETVRWIRSARPIYWMNDA